MNADDAAGEPSRRSNESLAEPFVRGERGWPVVAQLRSLQSRLSSVLACGLMLLLGLGALSWYYSSAYSRQRQARQTQGSSLTLRAQGDAPLPALGRIEPPRVGPADDVRRSTAAQAHPQIASADSAWSEAALPQVTSPPLAPALAPPQYLQQPAASTKSPEQMALERRTAGVAFARVSTMTAPTASEGTDAAALTAAAAGGTESTAHARASGELSALLNAEVVRTARANVLPTKRWLLPKGAFIDCTLETAIDSTLPGMATCVTASDTFGSDGEVVLLERGTKLVGETRGQVQQGAARVFVLWTEARTPAGIIVSLDSPAADELGRAGLSGKVDRHFWQRFGAAMLITTVDGAVQAAVQSASHGSGPLIYDPTGSAGILTEILKSTVNITPTIRKQNGDRIQVLVARDLDFRSVYELHRAVSAHE